MRPSVLGVLMAVRHLFAGLGALLLAAVFAPSVSAAQGISQKTATCDVGAPTHCIKPNADGSINVTATFSGSVTTSATASATPTPVTAGAARPINEGLFSNLFITPVTPAGVQVDLSAPSVLAGVDGSTAASLANPVPTTAGLVAGTADVGNVGVSQASTTSGQKGPLIQGAVTTAAPSYTTAQTSPLSLDTAGNLRVNVVTGGGAGGSTKVTINSPPNDVIAGPTAFTGTGNLPVNSQGAGAVGIQATGSGTGLTFTFQATANGSTWFNIPCGDVSGSVVTGGSANGQWICPASGWPQVRVNLTAISGGTETFTVNSSAGSASLPLGTQGTATNLTGVNGNVMLAGNGTAGTGAQRVVVASDNTAFSVNASPTAATTGGASVSSAIVANNTTSVAIDASAGTLYGVTVFNNSATIAYLKLYNASQGSTTCGSGTPVQRILIPANTSGAGAVIPFPVGVAYSTAISRCVTTGIADNDTGAPAASTYLVDAIYK